MSSLIAADPLALIAIEAGLVGAPLADAAADGSKQLDTQQLSAEIGEPIPIVFCHRVGSTGGILISPKATECRFENDTSNAVTAYYHLVLSEGQVDSVAVKDVFQGPCRVGSHTQTYNRRAGTWLPGNVIVAREGYEKPEASYYCGSVGVYSDLSTLSYQVTVGSGNDFWRKQVHVFIRGGMHVTRLLDSVVGPSNNYADLVHWCLVNSSKIPSSLVDTTALTTAANFLAANSFNCDIAITESTNLPDLLAKLSPYFLVTETRNLGKRGLRPLLPITAQHAINTGAISWEYTFTEDHVLPNSFEISYVPLADRKPFCAQMIWRQQFEDDFGLIRTSEVRYSGTAVDGPYEQHDLSSFCTTEIHAVKVGAFILARRRYITHTLRISCRPGAFNTTLVPGDIVRVKLSRAASSAAAVPHDYLYEVNRITKTLKGDMTLELTHFPVDDQGRSLVALDVDAATGTGIMLTSNKSGTGCDLNAKDNNSIPAESYLTGDYPDEQSTLDGYQEADPGDETLNEDDALDDQGDGIPLIIHSPDGSLNQGAILEAPNPCPENTSYQVIWYRDGEEIPNTNGRYYSIGALDISASGKRIRAKYICADQTETLTQTVITSNGPSWGDPTGVTVSITRNNWMRNKYCSAKGAVGVISEPFPSYRYPPVVVQTLIMSWQQFSNIQYSYITEGSTSIPEITATAPRLTSIWKASVPSPEGGGQAYYFLEDGLLPGSGFDLDDTSCPDEYTYTTSYAIYFSAQFAFSWS